MKERNSNIELLRIICMLMVMMLHFNMRGANIDILGCPGDLTLRNGIGHLFQSMCVVAVDCFVLISGYFGLHLKVRSLLRIYLQCFFIGLVSYLLYIAFTGQTIGVALFGRLFAFSHNHWWFLFPYLSLMFFSPFLNYAIDKMTKVQFRKALLVFAGYTAWFGYIRNVGDNCYGTSDMHFVFLYLIGRYIGKYTSKEILRANRIKHGVGYSLCVLFTYGLAIFQQVTHISSIEWMRPYAYVSWFVIGGAICLLLFMASFEFNSKLVNWISSSVFAAYLLQDSTYFGFEVLYPWSKSLFMNITNLWTVYGIYIGLSIGFLLLSVLIDKIGYYLLYRPMLTLYDRYGAPIVNKWQTIIQV